MLLRRVSHHVKTQNWFAVFLDLLIVVLGVYIGLQVQQWALEKERQHSEGQYLLRLHEEVEELIETRVGYDETRQRFSRNLMEVTELLKSDEAGLKLSEDQCRSIAHSSFTTVPPAEIPSVSELISSGRLERIASSGLRNHILSYIQDVARARDLIVVISGSNVDMSRIYPMLIKSQFTLDDTFMRDSVGLNAICDLNQIKNSPAFLNDFNINAFNYIIYTERGVLKVSQKLAELHAELDKSLGIEHPLKEAE